jgi:hypothetical protein
MDNQSSPRGSSRQETSGLCLNLYRQAHMNLLLLGRGKTGSLVAEAATARKHHVRIAGAKENADCAALGSTSLSGVD